MIFQNQKILLILIRKKKAELLNNLDNWLKKNNAPIPNKLNPFYNQKYVDSLMFSINNNKVSGKVNKNETS